MFPLMSVMKTFEKDFLEPNKADMFSDGDGNHNPQWKLAFNHHVEEKFLEEERKQ